MSQQFGIKVSNEFELAPTGRQPAICAEVSHELVEDRFEGKGLQHKLILSFQLLAEDSSKNNERYVLDLEVFPSITPTNKMGKLCASWSGRNEITQSQVNKWIESIFGKSRFFKRDNNGELLLDEKDRPIPESFDSWEDLLAATDPEPPLVGVTCIAMVTHKTAQSSGKTRAYITDIFTNGKVDGVGNIIKDANGRPEPAFEMDIVGYVSRADRQAEIQKRIAEKEAKKTGATAKPVTKPAKSVVPF